MAVQSACQRRKSGMIFTDKVLCRIAYLQELYDYKKSVFYLPFFMLQKVYI